MADTLSVDVKGFNRTANNIRRIGAQVPRDVEDETRRWGEDFAGELRATPYPAPPPNSSYVRTYNLKNRWRSRVVRHGVQILNQAGIRRRSGPYAIYPVGDAQGRGQAWMHVGRWWRFVDKLKPALRKLRKRLEKRIQRTIGR